MLATFYGAYVGAMHFTFKGKLFLRVASGFSQFSNPHPETFQYILPFARSHTAEVDNMMPKALQTITSNIGGEYDYAFAL